MMRHRGAAQERGAHFPKICYIQLFVLSGWFFQNFCRRQSIPDGFFDNPAGA
jgi:hypothetical protein